MTNNLTDMFSHEVQPYHLIYWLRDDYIHFKLSGVLN